MNRKIWPRSSAVILCIIGWRSQLTIHGNLAKRVVIATQNASFEDLIIDGVSGFLVPQDDNAELTACLDRVWKMTPDERGKIALRGFQSVERMKPAKAIKELIALFDAIIKR